MNIPPLPSLEEIESVAPSIDSVVPPTSAFEWPLLNKRVGGSLWVKHENHTAIGSFKIRGSLAYVARLLAAGPTVTGVIAATRGNFGQAVAFAARLNGLSATVVVPHGNSPEKNLELAQQQLSGPINSHAFRAQNAADRKATIDQTTLLHQILARALIVCGRYDWICPLALSERLQAGIPDSRLVVFEESGHFPWLEEPEKFTTELNKFLED